MIREAGSLADLETLVDLRRRIDPLTATTATDLQHFVAEATSSVCALASERERPVGFAWIAEWPDEEYASGTLGVLPECRDRGHGTALLDRAAAVFGRLQVSVDDGSAVGWFERRGFAVAERQVRVVLHLAAAEPPVADPSFLLTDSAERPDLMPALHVLFVAGHADIPGVLADEPPGLEAWLDAQKARSRRPDFRVIALEDGEPVGYAQLHVYPVVGYHGFATVAGPHRRRGIGRELKLELIRRAKQIGLERLITQSNEHNAPMRALNASLGYLETVPSVLLRRSCPPG